MQHSRQHIIQLPSQRHLVIHYRMMDDPTPEQKKDLEEFERLMDTQRTGPKAAENELPKYKGRLLRYTSKVDDIELIETRGSNTNRTSASFILISQAELKLINEANEYVAKITDTQTLQQYYDEKYG